MSEAAPRTVARRPRTSLTTPVATTARSQGTGTTPMRMTASLARQSGTRLRLAPTPQAQLEVNQPNDPFEQEADAVADRVMRMAAPTTVEPSPSSPMPLQRMVMPGSEEETCTACAQNPRHIQRMTAPDDEPVQRAPQDDEALQRTPQAEESVQRAGDGGGRPSVSPTTAATIRNSGSGQALSPGMRNRLEPHVGADLSSVRVHTGPAAQQAARSLRAQAFTHANNIFLRHPASAQNLRLMAHESTHVVQQGAAPVQRMPAEEEIQRQPAAAQSTLRQDGDSTTPATVPLSTGADARTATAPMASSAPAAGATASVGSETTPVAAPGIATVEPGGAPPASASTTGGGSTVAPTGAETVAAPVVGVAPAMGATGELLMPEPPAGLSAAEQARLTQVQGRVGAAATASEQMPTADSQASEAREAVEEPQEETVGRAESALVSALDHRPQPSPEIEALCKRIYDIIRSKRPPDEESLVDAEPKEMAQAAGGQLDSAVQGNVQSVEGSYSGLQQEQTGTPTQVPQDMAVVPGTVATPAINATAATPTGVAAEDVSLDADVAANRERMDDAGMNNEAAQLIQDPSNPVTQGREAQGELEEVAQRDPAEVMAEQQTALANASTDMAALQQRALEALQSARSSTVQDTHGQQLEMVGSEEQMRTQVSTRARAIVATARTQVQDLLRPMPDMARRRWDTGVAVLSTTFENDLARVKHWIDERHSGIGGAILGVADYLTGLPDWVTEEYDRAEQAFGDGVCVLLREISTEVNSVIAAAEAIIAKANEDVDALFNSLPTELQAWAVGERNSLGEQLNALHNEVRETQRNINQQLTQSASGAVQQVRERIHQLRQEAGGLVGRIVDAVNRFLEDPIKFIIEGLLSLVGIPPASFWALVNRIGQVIGDIADDPLGFANNLVSAIGEGFQKFFDHFADHLIGGFFEWLFSGLGSVGVTIPSDFSLKSIITFALELMGITWARIRQVLARHIGEENVALIEKAYELIATLIEQGPEGIFEMIKAQLNPQTILDQIIRAAVDFLIEALIRAVTPRIIALFNPAGAIVQAIEIIFRVLKWIFENAARIFSLVETVVNGAADLIAGNISGMATAVEGALARLIAPVIDFLAGFLGLGNLPDRIADTIRGFQEMVLGIIERVVAWLAQRARALLRALGIGGEEEGEEEEVSGVKAVVRDELQSRIGPSIASYEEASTALSTAFRKHQDEGLDELDIEINDTGKFDIYAAASPKTLLIGDVEYKLDTDEDRAQIKDLSYFLNPTNPATTIMVGINGAAFAGNPVRQSGRNHAENVFFDRHLPGIAEQARMRFEATGERTTVSLTLNRNPCGTCAPNVGQAQATHRQYIQFSVFFAGPYVEGSEFTEDKRTLTPDAHQRVVNDIAILIKSGVNVGATHVWGWFTEHHYARVVREYHGPQNQLKEELVAELIAEAREVAQQEDTAEEEKQRIGAIRET